MKLFPTMVVVFAAATHAAGHGVPTLLTTDEGRLALFTELETPRLRDDGFEIFSEDPGFGVLSPGTGPPTGAEIGLETLSGLLFWDGAALAPTDALLTIEAPETDSLGNFNNSPISEYVVAADSDPQSGLRWSRYPGSEFWDAHGLYLLDRPGDGPPEEGLYGVAARLIDQTGGVAPSDPFILSLTYGFFPPEITDTGLIAFENLIAESAPGDYDRDGRVDESDYQFWLSAFGASVVPGEGADGNGDGFVNAADYALWRDAFSNAAVSLTTPRSLAVPEPSAALVALVALLSSVTARRK